VSEVVRRWRSCDGGSAALALWALWSLLHALPVRTRRTGLGVPEMWGRETARALPDRSSIATWTGDTVSDVSARITKDVALQGRVQSLAAQCAASLEGHPNQRVAFMLAFMLGWESRAAEEIKRTREQLEAAEQTRRAGQ
jgi:hypothetical protein